MCTINMTFEVPETKHINIEALKKQMHSYLEFILSMPITEEKIVEKKYDMSFFDRFDNDWSDDPRDSHEIAADLHDARVNERPEIGTCRCHIRKIPRNGCTAITLITLHNNQDITVKK